MITILTALFLAAPAQAQSLTLTGACGDPIDIDAIGLTAGGPVAILSASGEGNATVPGGRCGGTALGLDSSFKLRITTTADASGEVHLSPPIPAAACGHFIQLVDVRTCSTTNTAEIGFVDADGDGFPVGSDCDDGDPDVYPGAPENIADGIDQDCDGLEDCYEDLDGDTFGSGAIVTSTPLDCSAFGVAPVPGDCNDTDPNVNPAAPEIIANGVDEDCDGGEICFRDVDGDGVGSTATLASPDVDCTDLGESEDFDDCDDDDATVFPGAPEVIADGVDQDCDGLDACFQDIDGDGFAGNATAPGNLGCTAPGEFATYDDCDDVNASVFPFAGDAAGDGVDQDCDGMDCEAASYYGGYYALCLEGHDWATARGVCQAAGYTDLASTSDPGEQGHLESLLMDAGRFGDASAWIGYADELYEGSWGWSDGTSFGYENWAPGEPNGGVDESCAVLNFPVGTGQWNDAACTGYLPEGFFCELR